MIASTAQIPFKTDPSVGLGQLFGVLLITVILLAAVFALLLYARRKGWLNQWSGGAHVTSQATKKFRWTTETQRISRQTTVHTLTQSGRVLVIVESKTGTAVASWSANEGIEHGHVDA